MSTSHQTIELILDRISGAGEVRARKMFGEYGLYCNNVFFGLVCDDQLHIKPTKQTTHIAANMEMAPAYPGAKPSIVIPPELWDDQDWLVDLVRSTTLALEK